MPAATVDATANARTYTGAALKEVAFTLGGIGTGTVSLGGRGELRDWELFNRPGKGHDLPYTFFAIWVQEQGEAGAKGGKRGQPEETGKAEEVGKMGKAVARVLERRLQPPFT